MWDCRRMRFKTRFALGRKDMIEWARLVGFFNGSSADKLTKESLASLWAGQIYSFNNQNCSL